MLSNEEMKKRQGIAFEEVNIEHATMLRCLVDRINDRLGHFLEAGNTVPPERRREAEMTLSLLEGLTRLQIHGNNVRLMMDRGRVVAMRETEVNPFADFDEDPGADLYDMQSGK